MNNRVVIVTGGAMGIGGTVVKDLPAYSARVAIFDPAKLKDSLGGDHGVYVYLDIRNKKEVEAAIDTAIQKFGIVDALIDDTGVTRPRIPIDYYGNESQYKLSEENFGFMIGISQRGTSLVPQAITRVLYGKKEGAIINLSPYAGLMGFRGHSCYSATKVTTHAFTISWAKELGPYDTRVVGVTPDILDRAPASNDERYGARTYGRGWDANTRPEEFFKNYKSSIPLGRPGHLYEAVDLICYLISDHASYITGAATPVSGGESKGQEAQGLNVTTRVGVQRSMAQVAFHKVSCLSIARAIEKAM